MKYLYTLALAFLSQSIVAQTIEIDFTIDGKDKCSKKLSFQIVNKDSSVVVYTRKELLYNKIIESSFEKKNLEMKIFYKGKPIIKVPYKSNYRKWTLAIDNYKYENDFPVPHLLPKSRESVCYFYYSSDYDFLDTDNLKDIQLVTPKVFVSVIK